MLEAFSTFSYAASALFMNAPNSAGLLVTGSASRGLKRVWASGESKALTNTWFSVFTTSTAVPAGATRPQQVSISKPLSV